jgi:HSP20 family molecular chaperone IbpA
MINYNVLIRTRGEWRLLTPLTHRITAKWLYHIFYKFLGGIFMNDFERIFDEFFTLGFGKPRRLVFNSQVKDMLPSYWTKKDDKTYLCTVKTLGINPEDVKVEETDYGIKVSGATEINGFTYDTSVELPIAESIMNEIEEIEVSSKNGLTFITLKLNRPEKKKIKIKKAE